MKKSLAIILSSSLLLGLNSCYKTEEDIWEDSSAVRTEKTLAAYEDALCAEENGWVLQYFANESEQAYPLLMKFKKNSEVTMAANNSVSSSSGYTEKASTFDLISDMGPVLTFNTYNQLLHCFSDPGTDGLGHLGDYEFQIMGQNEDGSFDLRGKKWAVNMKLVKFPKGATYTENGETKTVETWQDYYAAYNAIKNTMFTPEIQELMMNVGDEQYEVSGMNSGVLRFTPVGVENAFTTVLSYIINMDGTLTLVSPFTGENNSFKVQNFKLSDNFEIECIDDGQNAKIVGPSISDVVLSGTWKIDLNSLSGQFTQLFEKIMNEHNTILKRPLNYIQIIPTSTSLGHALTVNFGTGSGVSAQINLKMEYDGSVLKFSYDKSGDSNGENLLRLLPSYTEFLDFLTTTTFKVENLGTALMPISMKVASSSNDSFIMNKQ